MSITKIIKIVADTDDASKGLNKIKEGVEGVGDAANETSKEVEEVGKSADKTKKGFKSMSNGIKAVGTALKAAGIGLMIAIIAGMTEAFSRNKRVMDKVEIVMGTISQVFSQVANALITTYDAVTKSSDSFDALGKVVSSLITISLVPLKTTFYALVAAAQAVKLGYEKMFGDDDSVKQAQSDLDATAETLKEIAIDALQAGKDIVNNIGEAIGEVVEIASVASENLSKVSLEAAKNQAKANQLAIQGAAIAEAEAGRLVAQFERQAELQRQIRDDVSKSVKERQEANNKLATILDDQEKALLRQADAIIAGANAELQKNNSIENQAALINAVAGKEQVLADVAGKRSEQLVNQVALLKEQKDLTVTVTDAELERQRIQREFEAEKETDPLKKLEIQKTGFDLENEAILNDLTRKKLLYAEGTQARIDAEQDYLNKKQELDNKAAKNAEDTTKVKIKINDLEAKSKIDTLSAIQNAFTGFAAIAGKQTEEAKALGVAGALISTYSGMAGVWKKAASPELVTDTAMKVAASASILASGFSSIKSILSVKVPNSSGASGNVNTPSAPSAPAFNLVEGTESNQINESINLQNQEPIQAYVVSGDVTTAQNLDDSIISESGL